MSGITIRPLRCGSISVPEYLPYGGAARRFSPGAALTPPSRRVTLPVYAYLIEHPSGLILVDTGWSREISPRGEPDTDALKRLLPRADALTLRGSVGMGETAAEQLAAMGIRPADLTCVLLTTLDADHVCGARDLRGARRVLASQEEMFWSYRAGANFGRALIDGLGADTFWFHGAQDVPFRWASDLTGDGSVTMVYLPGHSEGCFGVMVANGERFALLTSDAAYSPRSWRDGVLPGKAVNGQRYAACLEWIRAQSEKSGCAAILSTHDHTETRRVIEL